VVTVGAIVGAGVRAARGNVTWPATLSDAAVQSGIRGAVTFPVLYGVLHALSGFIR